MSATSRANPEVDQYVKSATTWRQEVTKLRAILLGCPLTEDLKWGKPCYSFQGNNLVGIARLKESCALAFFKGALLKDARGLLIKPGMHSQSGRWMKFTAVREIEEKKSFVQAYVDEAIKAEKAGLKVVFKTNPEPVPEELQKKLDEKPALKMAFHALTPGRQRGYILYFSGAKQSATRAARVEKYIPRILKGKGMLDR